MHKHERVRSGIGALVLVMAILLILGIWAASSWSVSRNLMFQVAMAEAGRSLQVACESAAEESMEGLLRSVNFIGPEPDDEDQRKAREFAVAVRELKIGEMVSARFEPKNSRKAAPDGIRIQDIEITAFLERELPGEPIPPGACANLRAVMAKWEKVGG